MADIWQVNFEAHNAYRVPMDAALFVYLDKLMELPEDLTVSLILGANEFDASNLPYTDPSGTVYSDGTGYLEFADHLLNFCLILIGGCTIARTVWIVIRECTVIEKVEIIIMQLRGQALNRNGFHNGLLSADVTVFR